MLEENIHHAYKLPSGPHGNTCACSVIITFDKLGHRNFILNLILPVTRRPCKTVLLWDRVPVPVIESAYAFHPVQNAPHALAHALLVNSWHSISVFFYPTLLMNGLFDGLPIFTVGNCFNDLLVSLAEVFKFLIRQFRQRAKIKSTFIFPVIFLLVPGLFHLLGNRLFQLVPIQHAALLGGQHFLPGHC